MINFKKISAIVGSGLMVGMTMGVAAAANYPAPFVSGGAANVAIVYGTGSGVSILDAVEAGSVQANLQSFMGSTSGTTSGSVTGEAAALFTGGTKLYINDSLNTVKTTVTKSELPIALADETFSGNVDATITQSVKVGKDPRITFEKQPTSSDDPSLVLKVSTDSNLPMFNLTATLSKAVNFSHSDSEGSSMTLFGMPVTVGSATDQDTLVLLKSAEKLDLSSDAPTADVTVMGATYTVELVSASDSAATVKVTKSDGTSESKEINEAASKKISGITVAVVTADETNLKLSASIIAGSDKITLEDGGSVLIGESDEVVDGTRVQFGSTTTESAENLTTLTIEFDAPDSDQDAIKAGSSYTDPVFGTIKLDFSGVNIPEASTTARETITVRNNGDEAVEVVFTERRGNEISTIFAVNGTTFFDLVRDDSSPYYNISVREHDALHAGDYVVVGNEDDGTLLKLESTANSTTSGTSSDKARFVDIATGDTLDTTWSAEGTGTLNVGGLSYTVTMTGDGNNNSEQRTVRLNYPDSTAAGLNESVVIYPTIETDKGANFAFYSPQVINFTAPKGDDRFGGGENNISSLLFPDGDGYETITITAGVDSEYNQWQINDGGTLANLTLNNSKENQNGDSVPISIGRLMFNITNGAQASVDGFKLTANGSLQGLGVVFLKQPGGGNIMGPALIIWEEKDDNNEYNAVVVTLENGLNADDGMGIDDLYDTWSNGSSTWESTLKTDSDISKSINLWGTIMSEDNSDSDQKIATISYPDEQVYAELYIAKGDALITAGTAGSSTSTQLGDVLVKDSEVTSVSTKNLVVVGGSCINSVAAKLVGGAYCGPMWTEKTGAGSGQFLIQSFGDAYTTGKVALLVAGYDVADTANAGKYLRTQTVKTDASTKYLGTSATSATLQTTQTSTTTTGNTTA